MVFKSDSAMNSDGKGQLEMTKSEGINKLETSGFRGSLPKVPASPFSMNGKAGIPAAKGVPARLV